MLTASIDGFERNWWPDKQEYHLDWSHVIVRYTIEQKTASCKVMRQNVEGGSEA